MALEGGLVDISADHNTTTSKLAFTPAATDHGLILTCKASNQRIPLSEMRDTWMLRVLYPPKVSLTLGHGLDANDIKEGADVYFECHLVANPWVSVKNCSGVIFVRIYDSQSRCEIMSAILVGQYDRRNKTFKTPIEPLKSV